MTVAEIDGAEATAEQLRSLALAGYGHFTSLQVRGGAVHGLAHHLERLDRQSHALFGRGLDGARVRGLVRHALAGTPDASVRVTVFSGEGRRPGPVAPGELHVLVTADPPLPAQTSPLRVCTVAYERDLPEVKHVATFGLTWHWRRAQALGFDDALFVDRNGMISEGTVWNAGFSDGARVIWPDAGMLRGVSMRLLKDGLDRLGVPWEVRPVPAAEVSRFPFAFSSNSISPVRPIAAIDEAAFAPDDAAITLLRSAYASVPPESL
ncbi:branched-subunit amino acid aminotransferase/4-amino-4-deoxychorismate lyase [Catenuloplanes nepalensis]|uniref:Branched-subunit amino acid aminotransferase/4-amino-4-deoxychorismate lyase n=1 Tax=Catenuloplanes nepalensis TaxID=587533 RepID=A0ABT9N0S5_9ACTN|nr:aminotransferase class IV family protein [Catenuloplanes nepalensis]MDP9797297.1 branched-subunit amino acid aminotransferase/4-amino-4-deoxychorismate lyase [Catenuloplanes nepalensis]